MSAITLDQADRLIDAILARGAELDCRPLSVIVVEPGCKVKAFKKEDGSSMIRFEMAYGKAYAALAMGRSSKLVKVRAEEKPIFMRYLLSATGDQNLSRGRRLANSQCRGRGHRRGRRDRRHRGSRRGARRPWHSRDRIQDRRGLRGDRSPRRHPADQHVTPPLARIASAHVLIGKPVPTFPEHALPPSSRPMLSRDLGAVAAVRIRIVGD